MKKLLLISALSISCINYSQNLDYNNSYESINICTAIQGNNFASETAADSALDDILNVIGASKRFVLQECSNINNAVALTMNGVRYIMYDPEFMVSLSYGDEWSNKFILAHEVGHHINGHTVDVLAANSTNRISLSTSRTQELEADEFAGFVLGRLGASLSEALSGVQSLSDKDDSYSTHPRRSKRIAAIKRGFSESGGKTNITKDVSSKYSNKAFVVAKTVIKNIGDDIYEGTVDSNGYPFGVGKYRMSSGAVYEGEFSGGKFNGYGTIKWPSGSQYEGDFLNSYRTGYGVYTQADGIKQIGYFVKNKGVKIQVVSPDSESDEWITEFEYSAESGNLIYEKHTNKSDGRIEESGFLDGSKGNGYTTFTYKDGRKITGVFKNGGIKKSRGILIFNNGYDRFGSNKKLHKKYKKAGIEYGILDLIPDYVRAGLNFAKKTTEAKRVGLGRYEPDNNDYDHLGYGTIKWPSGIQYKGYFKAGTKLVAGYGEMFYDDNDERYSYKGIWWDNRRNGYGQLTYKNGKVEKGIFKDSEFIKNEDFDLELVQELFKGY